MADVGIIAAPEQPPLLGLIVPVSFEVTADIKFVAPLISPARPVAFQDPAFVVPGDRLVHTQRTVLVYADAVYQGTAYGQFDFINAALRPLGEPPAPEPLENSSRC